MNFKEFAAKYSKYQVIFVRDIVYDVRETQLIRNQLLRWQNKGLVIKLKRGVYTLNDDFRRVGVDKNYIANILYEPSYLSLEYALNFYGLIPERVIDITSVTTRKTMTIKNPLGVFVYQHVKPQAFRGFRGMGKAKYRCLMAEPEKAVIDFLYLNLGRFGVNIKRILEESYRFQNLDMLKEDRLIELGKLFYSKKLIKVIECLCQLKRGK